MVTTERPRVGAIGLSDTQLESIGALCKKLKAADSLRDYRDKYAWTETDVVVAVDANGEQGVGAASIDPSISLLMFGVMNFAWSDTRQSSYGMGQENHYVSTYLHNTERELSVAASCPKIYTPLATQLVSELGRSEKAPMVVRTTRRENAPLITTTSGHHVASRIVLPSPRGTPRAKAGRQIALLLPRVHNLAAWFRAFLTELHKLDPVRVPQAPPRLFEASDWYTLKERSLTDQISNTRSKLETLNTELGQLETKLVAETAEVDRATRRALWADGDDLTSAAKEILSDLGFAVRDMDAELAKGEPKHEDLRLTLPSAPDWEAIVEVKGYPNSTKTSDARQIREYRERYISEERRPPDLTVWLANPFRNLEPSSRPVPDSNVKDTAEAVGALHVLVPDLYRQWALVEAERLDRQTVIDSLVNAEPGLWVPPVPLGGT